MKQSEITENNKLIAEFMEIDYDTLTSKKGFFTRNNYQHSWDLLMPVVEKVESLNFIDKNDLDFSFDVMISYGDCTIQDEDTTRKYIHIYKHSLDSQDKIGATYQAVCEFINWYNENK